MTRIREVSFGPRFDSLGALRFNQSRFPYSKGLMKITEPEFFAVTFVTALAPESG